MSALIRLLSTKSDSLLRSLRKAAFPVPLGNTRAQSAVSYGIANLEQALELSLFDPQW